MEDEKKKKRNKKKKNKQNANKRADDDVIATGVATSEDGNHTGDGDIAQISQVPDANELQPINVVETVSSHILDRWSIAL